MTYEINSTTATKKRKTKNSFHHIATPTYERYFENIRKLYEVKSTQSNFEPSWSQEKSRHIKSKWQLSFSHSFCHSLNLQAVTTSCAGLTAAHSKYGKNKMQESRKRRDARSGDTYIWNSTLTSLFRQTRHDICRVQNAKTSEDHLKQIMG